MVGVGGFAAWGLSVSVWEVVCDLTGVCKVVVWSDTEGPGGGKVTGWELAGEGLGGVGC